MKCAWAGLRSVPLCAVWAVARQACWKPAESTTQRWLCATICHASSLPYSMANQPWQDDGWTAAAAKSHCWQTVLKLRTFSPLCLPLQGPAACPHALLSKTRSYRRPGREDLRGCWLKVSAGTICSMPPCDNPGSEKTSWIAFPTLPKPWLTHLPFCMLNTLFVF